MKREKLYQWQKDLISEIMKDHWDDLKKVREYLKNGNLYDLVLYIKEKEDYIYSKNHDWGYAGVLKDEGVSDE